MVALRSFPGIVHRVVLVHGGQVYAVRYDDRHRKQAIEWVKRHLVAAADDEFQGSCSDNGDNP